MKLFKQLGLPVVLALGLTACDGANTVISGDASRASVLQSDATGNIVQTAVDAGTFNILAQALTATGLDAVLADETRQFTVFAPNDAAFAALGDDTINSLLSDPETLSDILLYHVIADQNVGSATAISLAGGSVAAANGDDLQLSLQDGKLFINTSEVIAADVAATNGTSHVINSVLLPPANDESADEGGNDSDGGGDMPQGSNIVETALAAGSFNTLAAALEATGLVSVLANEDATFTVFAPTDAAFKALGQETIDALLADPDTLRDILLYHVISDQAVDAATAISLAGNSVAMTNGDEVALSLDGGNLFVNDSQVVATDVRATNGIIHVIDAVLLPPADEEAPAPELDSIYNTAIAAGNFKTLVAALQVTGLDGPLAGDHETYTVFAPTDDAFAALGQETIDTLIAHPDVLKNILLYHVIPGAVDAETALSLAGNAVTMANGGDVQLTVRDGQLFVNDSLVIVTDIYATNGIIHVIDTVLIPH